MPTTKLSSTNHQYSERRARPLNVAYLLKQVLIACKKLFKNYSIILLSINLQHASCTIASAVSALNS